MTDDAWHYFAIFSQVAAANKLCLVDMHDRNANPAEGQGDLCPALLSVSRASGQRYGALTLATYGRSFVWCWHADSRKLQRWIACVKVHFQDGIPWDPKMVDSKLRDRDKRLEPSLDHRRQRITVCPGLYPL
jgi:hypothetical protein